MKLFPSKSQWIKWSLPSKASYIGALVGGLGILIAILIPVIQAIRHAPIVVVPASIDVSPGYSKKSLIKIVNNEDFPVYQVDLQISVETGDLSVDDIKLNPKDESKLQSEIKSESGGIVISHDVFGIGMITNEGKREDHFIIYDLDAHSTKEFIAETNANNTHQKSKVAFQIARWAREQADIIRSRGDVAENRDFISLSHEMEIPMAEIARHVGVCGSAVVKAIRRMESADQIHRFHQRPLLLHNSPGITRSRTPPVLAVAF